MARTVGDLIAEARSRVKGYGRRGMSQATLIEKMGLDKGARSWLTQVETGRVLKPDPERLRLVADALGTVTFRELLAASEQLDYLTGAAPAATAARPAGEDLTSLIASQAALIKALGEQNDLLRQLLERLTVPQEPAVPIGSAAAAVARQRPLPLRPVEPPPTPATPETDR